MHKEWIIEKLKENGGRITKQRLMLLDIILENECLSCKEIFYKAVKKDPGIGTATVYRMMNTLEEMGVISRQNMYQVVDSLNCSKEQAYTVVLNDSAICRLSRKQWDQVIHEGLTACGYLKNREIRSIAVKPCACENQ